MHYRTVDPPRRWRVTEEFYPSVMMENLREMQEDDEREKQMVLDKLPIRIDSLGSTSLWLEPSRYHQSIALILRERKRFLFVRYEKTTAVHLWIPNLADFADELEHFDTESLGGDSWKYECTCWTGHGKPFLFYERHEHVPPVYVLESRQCDKRRQATSITFDYFAMQRLIKALQSFGLRRKGWRGRKPRTLAGVH